MNMKFEINYKLDAVYYNRGQHFVKLEDIVLHNGLTWNRNVNELCWGKLAKPIVSYNT